MRRLLLFVTAAGCLTAADPAKEGISKELEKFRGTWKYASMQQDGRPLPDGVPEPSGGTTAGPGD